MLKAINTAHATTNGRITTQSIASRPGGRLIILPVDGKIPPLPRPEGATDIDWAVG
jgi:hypothetical protein